MHVALGVDAVWKQSVDSEKGTREYSIVKPARSTSYNVIRRRYTENESQSQKMAETELYLTNISLVLALYHYHSAAP